MKIEHVRENLERRARSHGLVYVLGEKVPDEVLATHEGRLNLAFPRQLKIMYGEFDGMEVTKPRIRILPLRELSIRSDQLMVFSTVDENKSLAFDVSHYNSAEQWDIVNPDGRALVTLTLASFWSNKIWAWIDKERRIWESSAVGECPAHETDFDE